MAETPAAPAAAATNITTGTVNDGVVKHGVVSLYCVASGTLLASGDSAGQNADGLGYTDGSGKFKLTWTGNCPGAAKVVVKPHTDGNTKMEVIGAADIALTKPVVGIVADIAAELRIDKRAKKVAADNGEDTVAPPKPIAQTVIHNNVIAANVAAGAPNPTTDPVGYATYKAILDAPPPTNAQIQAACPGGVCTVGVLTAAQLVVANIMKQDTAMMAADPACGGTITAACAADAFSNLAASLPTKTDLPAGTTYADKLATTSSGFTLPPDVQQTVTTIVTAAQTSSAGGKVIAVDLPPAPTGIPAARDLFVSLSNDFKALINKNDSSGFLDTKLSAVNADWNANGLSSTTGVVNVLTALDRATAMAGQAPSANWTVSGTLQANTLYPTPDSSVFLLTDANGASDRYVRFFDTGAPTYMACSVKASDKSAGKAGCYYSTGQANSATTGNVFTGYYHAVEVASTGTAGSFNWSDFTASRNYTTDFYKNPSSVPNIAGNERYVPSATAPTAGAAQTGTATGVARDSAGNMTAGTFTGNILPLVSSQDHSTLAVSMSTSASTSTTQTYALSGSVTNVNASNTATFTMTLNSGSTLTVTTGSTQHIDSLSLSALFKTASFQYEGVLAMNTFTASKNGEYSPAYTKFDGKMSTLSGSIATEFLSGTLTVRMTNLADYDPRTTTGASNFIKETDSFVGRLTASVNSTPLVYNLAYDIDGTVYGQQTLNLNYTNPTSQLINVKGTSYTGGTPAAAVTVTSGNVVVSLTGGVGDVKVSGTKVGDVTKSGVFFSDASYILM